MNSIVLYNGKMYSVEIVLPVISIPKKVAKLAEQGRHVLRGKIDFVMEGKDKLKRV